MTTYFKGTRVQLRCVLKNTQGALVDATVSAKIVVPGSTSSSSLTVTRESLGVYVAETDADTVGEYFFRFEANGALKASNEGSFTVRTSLANF